MSEKTRKFEPPSRKVRKVSGAKPGIVQNRVTVLDKAAFSFAVTRQMKNVTFAFLAWRPERLELVRLNAAERHSKAVFNWAKQAVQDSLGWVAGSVRFGKK